MSVFTAHLKNCSILANPAAARIQTSAKPLVGGMSFIGSANDVPKIHALTAANRNLRNEITEAVETLHREASEKCRECSETIKTLDQERGDLVEDKAGIYSELDADRSSLSKTEAEYAGKLEKINLQKAQMVLDQGVIDELRCKINNAKKKEKALKKWCWVPGYGIYLAVDCLIDDEVKHLNATQNNLNRFEKEVKMLYNEIVALEPLMKKCSLKSKLFMADIKFMETEISDVIQCVNDANRELFQWMELQDYYVEMAAGLKAGRVMPEEIQEQLGKMSQQLANIA